MIDKVFQLLEKKQLDALVVTSVPNKVYFQSLKGSGVYLVITKSEVAQFFDGRYLEEIKEKTNASYRRYEVPKGRYLEEIRTYLCKQAATRVGIEPVGLTIQDYHLLTATFDICLLQDELECIRSIKTKAECQKIQAVCQLTDEVFTTILPQIKIGMTELELSGIIHYEGFKRGASAMAFEPIIASGFRGAYPHGRPTTKRIEHGELLTIDFGLTLDHYQSDMTRTLAVGSIDSKRREIYQTVLSAQKKAVAAVRSGLTGSAVDQIARKVIEEAGYGEYFAHGLGHGIGMGNDVPILNPSSQTILKEGMVMTCEPGIYIPDIGGVRIEDVVMIQGEIGKQVTLSEKELIEVG
ncbi:MULTISPECIES: aminopeptidase P family protein [unclassified Streptococcus]|uniref:aminopeptidase P family protein n=1 Tax=unclassified Streptococcus TaxID=2608887 RepID=UPI001FD7BB17|nr:MULTISPECIES: aminopeptidase P family protein [unclassified Streptococcus]MCQ9212452.1 aminopeptidase P family protein [Streptococcus sp. B01]MCQ9213790.1 aminopeptidase P family protein [Streptococcus sp. O1]